MNSTLKISYSSPRMHIYFPDGRGRDSYIYTNNGGNFRTPVNFSPGRNSQSGFFSPGGLRNIK